MKILESSLCLLFLVLLLLSGNFKVIGQELCGADYDIELRLDCNDITFDNYDPYSPGKSYHIPIYVYLLRLDNGSGGISKSDALSAIRLALPKFSAHGIYPYVACIDEYHSDTTFKNANYALFNDLHDIPSGGLLAYIASEHINPILLGNSKQDGRKFFAKFGSQTELADTRLFAHEMGHSIGLLHTYLQNKNYCDGSQSACPEYSGINSEGCETSGDKVCDTPGDNTLYDGNSINDCLIDNTSECLDPNGNLYINIPMDNIMNYFFGTCNNSMHFTPGQGKRMRHFLQTRVWDQAIDPSIIIINEDVEITTQVVWDEDRLVTGDIIIKRGGSLKLEDITLTIFSGRNILVETGGILRIEGSVITTFTPENACTDGDASENMWQGIVVMGDPNYTQWQKDGDGYWRQGRVSMTDGSVIEHAVTGISVGNSSSTGGGVVGINSSTIRNCNTGVLFNHYIHKGGGFIFDNLSNFLYANFITDMDFRGVNFNTSVLLNSVNGIQFYGCDFVNTFEDDDNTKGIFAYNSYFRVDAEAPMGTLFSGFRHAIETRNPLGTLSFRVRHANFEKNKLGVYSSSTNYGIVEKSAFEVGNYADEEQTQEGIFVEAGTGFLLHDNSFTGVGPAERTIGIRVKDSGPNSNVIRGNSFSEMVRGNQAEGVNVNESIFGIGLSYFCNTNTDVVETDFRTFLPGVNRAQGTIETPAKNTFSHTNNSLPSDWWNDLGMMPIVYRCRNISAEIPNYVQNVNDQIIFGEIAGCPSSIIIEGPVDHPDTNLRPDVSALKTRISALMDGGDTESLIDDIGSETGTGASQLYSDISNISPWVSSSVLREVSDRTDLYSEAEIFELIWDNPDALYDESLVDHLLEKSTPMSQILVDSLLTRYGAVTSRTPYLDSLSSAMIDLQAGITLYLHQELPDTNGMSLEHLLSIVSPVSGEFKPGDVIGAYIITEDIEGAFSYYDSIRMSPDLSLLEEQWYNEVKILMDALDSMDQNQTNWTDLDEWMIDSIYALINNSHPWVEAMAICVLNEWFDEDYFHDPLWDEPEPQPLISSVAEEIPNSVKKDFMKLFPNPSNGIIQFRILEDKESLYALSIMDAQGFVLRLQEFSDAWLFDCYDCPSGWYFYRIIGMDGSMQTGKFSIVK